MEKGLSGNKSGREFAYPISMPAKSSSIYYHREKSAQMHDGQKLFFIYFIFRFELENY